MKIRSIGAAFALGVAALAGTVSPAQAAYPTSSFYVKYGNSYTKGTVVWYNKSADVKYTQHAATNCRHTDIVAWSPRAEDHSTPSCVLNDPTSSGTLHVEKSDAGGYTGIIIYLTSSLTGETIAADICYYGNEYCTNYV